MRNLVAKNNFNRASTHRAKNSYSRKWSTDYDELEPPKCIFLKKYFEGSNLKKLLLNIEILAIIVFQKLAKRSALKALI